MSGISSSGNSAARRLYCGCGLAFKRRQSVQEHSKEKRCYGHPNSKDSRDRRCGFFLWLEELVRAHKTVESQVEGEEGSGDLRTAKDLNRTLNARVTSLDELVSTTAKDLEQKLETLLEKKLERLEKKR